MAADSAPTEESPPSYGLRFLEQAAREPVRWEARLIERDARGWCTFWSWRILEKGEPDPRLTYAALEHPVREDVELWVEVRQREGDWLGRARVASARGFQDDPVELELIQVAIFGGGVVDGEGEPVLNSELRLYQVRGSRAPVFYPHPHLAWTDPRGEFRFAGVEPGYYLLRIVTEGREPVHLQLELKGGDSESYELKMTTLESTGSLPIAVLGVDDNHSPTALLTLKSLDGQGVWRVIHPRLGEDPRSQMGPAGVGYAGLFTELPEGSYELSVLGLDSNPYAPERQELSFADLGEGVRVQARPTEAFHGLGFDVIEARSGEALGDCFLRFSSPAWWASRPLNLQPTDRVAELHPDMPTPEWMVGKPGYRPVFGRFQPGADGGKTQREVVKLIPGWGCELLFRDGALRLPPPEWDSWRKTGAVQMADPLEGVTVLADGKEVGRSDANGRVRIVLPERPGELVFEKPGWFELPHHLTGFSDAHDLSSLGAHGSTVVWFDRRD